MDFRPVEQSLTFRKVLSEEDVYSITNFDTIVVRFGECFSCPNILQDKRLQPRGNVNRRRGILSTRCYKGNGHIFHHAVVQQAALEPDFPEHSLWWHVVHVCRQDANIACKRGGEDTTLVWWEKFTSKSVTLIRETVQLFMPVSDVENGHLGSYFLVRVSFSSNSL